MPPALEVWSLNHWTARKVPQIIHFYPHYLFQCSINVEWMNDSLAPCDLFSKTAMKNYGLPLIPCKVMTKDPLQTGDSIGTSFTLSILPDGLRNLSLQYLLILFLLFLLHKLYNLFWLQLLTLKIGSQVPGSPVVRTPQSHCQGLGSISGLGAKIPQAAQDSPAEKMIPKSLFASR